LLLFFAGLPAPRDYIYSTGHSPSAPVLSWIRQCCTYC
jgi:hypothetical protein